MRKKFTYRFIGFVFASIFILQSQTVFAQWTLDVVGTIKKEETNKRIEGSTITIKRNGTVWKTLLSSSNGKFQASLEPEAIYLIEFSRPGHVTKRIQFSTKNVPPDDAKYGFEFPLEMNLFEKVEGLDVSILDKPIGKVQFNPSTGYMDFDAAYTKTIKKELDRLKKELAERLKSEEENRQADQNEYNLAIAAADKAFKAEKWAEAKPLYEKAISIFPDESYPKNQLTDIFDKLAGLDEENKKYQTAIDKADLAFKAREWTKAISSYEIALGLKEAEQYPKDKLKEIEDALAGLAIKKAKEEAAEKMARAEKDEKYKEAIKLADNAFDFENYDQAKIKYTEALAIKPTEQYPKDKLDRVEKALTLLAKKNEEDELAMESERKKREYFDALIAEGDAALLSINYEEAVSKYTEALGVIAGEKYPADKLEEIKAILDKIQTGKVNANIAEDIENKYNEFITLANKAFEAKNYDDAKDSYQSALGLKEYESYPKSQIVEIDRLIADMAAKDSEITLANNALKQKEDQYNLFIKSGDIELSAKKYKKAISAYEQALGLKPSEKYPKEKIDKIRLILSDIKTKQSIDEAAILAEQEKRKEYEKFIYEGDRSMKLKEYTTAQVLFKDALVLYESEMYPKDKLAQIGKILEGLSKPEEIVVSNSSYTGNRAKINRDKEIEIEAKMAALLGKSIVKRDQKIQKNKDEYFKQEEIRISASISRITAADEQKDRYAEGIYAQAEKGNKFHIENNEAIMASVSLLQKVENNRVKKADKRRTESDEDIAIYAKEQYQFTKKQEELSKEKMEAHYIYVDNLIEAELIMVEKTDKKRYDNRIVIEKIKEESLKSQSRNKKKREGRDLDVKKYKEELKKGEEIRVSGAIKRSNKNGVEIKELNEKMEKMKAEKTNYYKLNISELIELKEKINQLETKRVLKAEKDRADYKNRRQKIELDYKKKSDVQDDKYYKDIEYLKEYKDNIEIAVLGNVKNAKKRRDDSNKKVLKEKGRLGEVNLTQEKKYIEFQKILKQEKNNNNNFHLDLKTIERTEIMEANAALKGFYMGEKRESKDTELASKYPQGITEETVDLGNSIVIKRIKVTDNHADVYERVFYNWGGTYFFKNGVNIARALWDKESIN